MNKLFLGRECIFVFRLANREVLWCVWSISTAKETMLQVYYLESNREDIELLHKEIQNRHNITLNYHLATSLPKYCWQTCCLMTERDWLQMAPKLWHQVSEILPEIRCMCLGYYSVWKYMYHYPRLAIQKWYSAIRNPISRLYKSEKLTVFDDRFIF